MEHTCGFCDRSFDSGRKLGSHMMNCKLNPKYAEILAKRIISQTKERVTHVLTCLKCPNTFTLVLTKKQLEIGKHKKYCSRSCANGHEQSAATKAQIQASRRAQPRLPKWVEDTCIVCHRSFERKRVKHPKTCSNAACRFQHKSQSLKGNASGKRGGYRPRSVQSYNDTPFDSKWEVLLAKRLDELQIPWERDVNRFLSYHDLQGRKRRYYPDFYLPTHDMYLEVKGYATPATKHKMSDASERNCIKLVVLSSLNEIGLFEI